MIALLTIERAACTGCGACVDSCPTDVLRIDSEDGRAYPAFPEDCQGCRLCVIDCPREAIRLIGRIKDPRPVHSYIPKLVGLAI